MRSLQCHSFILSSLHSKYFQVIESVTETFAYWKLPSDASSAIKPTRLASMNYTKPRLTKRKRNRNCILKSNVACIKNPFHSLDNPETQTFLKNLQDLRPSSSILRTVKPFHEAFVGNEDLFAYSVRKINRYGYELLQFSFLHFSEGSTTDEF